jgi:hypothetical protein
MPPAYVNKTFPVPCHTFYFMYEPTLTEDTQREGELTLLK